MKQPSLLTCVLLDIAGYLTYLIPFIGEWGYVILGTTFGLFIIVCLAVELENRSYLFH